MWGNRTARFNGDRRVAELLPRNDLDPAREYENETFLRGKQDEYTVVVKVDSCSWRRAQAKILVGVFSLFALVYDLWLQQCGVSRSSDLLAHRLPHATRCHEI